MTYSCICGKGFTTEQKLGVHRRFSKKKECIMPEAVNDNMLELYLAAVGNLRQERQRHVEEIERIDRDLERVANIARSDDVTTTNQT